MDYQIFTSSTLLKINMIKVKEKEYHSVFSIDSTIDNIKLVSSNQYYTRLLNSNSKSKWCLFNGIRSSKTY